MMLLKRTEQLIDELKTFELLQNSSNESKHYIQRNDELKMIVIYVDKLSELVHLFRKQGFIVDIGSIVNYPIELFKTMYQNWVADKKSIIQKNDFIRRVEWNDIDSEIKSLLGEKWKKYIDEQKPNINKETLDVFEQIPDFEKIVFTLKEKLELLEEIKNNLPMDDNSFQLILKISFEMQELIEKLESNNIPDSVSNFLKKAGTYEGIDLSEITTEILDWLKENNLIHLCQVKFRK